MALPAAMFASPRPTGATRGVYVCAWFPTEQWDDLADSRRPLAAVRDRDAVVRSLTDAAQSAGKSGEVEVAAVARMRTEQART